MNIFANKVIIYKRPIVIGFLAKLVCSYQNFQWGLIVYDAEDYPLRGCGFEPFKNI